VIRITNGKRDYVIDNLRKCGIECGMHYKSNHLLEYFKLGYSLPVSELLMEELLTLPLHPVLTDEEQSHVIETFKKALNETGDA
jgi:dTDP-4-amino-4,6-dideoxygalactose transaminase